MLLFQSRFVRHYLEAVLQIEPLEGRGQQLKVRSGFVVVLRVVDDAFWTDDSGTQDM